MIIFSTTSGDHGFSFEPDMYELRLDLSNDWFHVPDFFDDKKTIITLRDRGEGGSYTGCIDKKIEFYLHVLDSSDFCIDIELEHVQKLPLLSLEERALRRIIISVHDFSDDGYSNFCELITKSEFKHNCFFYKFVYNIDLLTKLYDMSVKLKRLNINFTLLSTGKTSLVSRILYKSFDSMATYFGETGATTAPNQITEKEVLLYNLRELNKSTKIGGIIGGSQVLKSRGLTFYNQYFRENKLNAVYLPFVIDDINDLVDFVTTSNMAFYGFSVTMPFKGKLYSVVGAQKAEGEIVNLWIPNDNKLYLTDVYAFEEAFIKLKISDDTKIALIGTGAMAKTVVELLPNNEIYLYARDEAKIDLFINTYHNVKKADSLNHDNTCLINTTPLGMNEEDVLNVFPLIKFSMAIDLPYDKKKTKLVEYCHENNFPVVDGVEFWKLQAEKQLEIIRALV